MHLMLDGFSLTGRSPLPKSLEFSIARYSTFLQASPARAVMVFRESSKVPVAVVGTSAAVQTSPQKPSSWRTHVLERNILKIINMLSVIHG